MKLSVAGLLVVISSVLSLGAAQSTFYDRYCTDPTRTGYLVAYPPDYSKFVWCLDGAATVESCPAGKLFDANYNVCLGENIATVGYPNVFSVPQYATAFCDSIDKLGMTIPAIECDKYYVCRGVGSALEITCPTGQHFSRAYQACMSPLKAGCKALNTMCLDQFSGYQFASLQCETYYVCNANLMPELKSCSPGLYYNMVEQICTSPQLSNCVPETVPTYSPLPPFPTTPNPCGPPNCNPSNNGMFYENKQKCNWYYMCFNSTALEMQCECGQYYDAQLKYCRQDTNNVCNAS